MFNFTGASSHQILCYSDVHLEGRQISTDVIHLGINNILRDRSQSNIDVLLQKIMFLKCKKYDMKNIFFYNYYRKNIVILEKIHAMFQNFPRNMVGFMSITDT